VQSEIRMRAACEVLSLKAQRVTLQPSFSQLSLVKWATLVGRDPYLVLKVPCIAPRTCMVVAFDRPGLDIVP
jgi:hypothetical protein